MQEGQKNEYQHDEWSWECQGCAKKLKRQSQYTCSLLGHHETIGITKTQKYHSSLDVRKFQEVILLYFSYEGTSQ